MRSASSPQPARKKRERINVVNLRALKPLDMIRIESITRVDTGVPIALTASEDVSQEFFHEGGGTPTRKDLTYTLNSKYISVNFESGKIDIIYKAVATDEECYPLVLDNETLLRCVESYIKYKWFDILNDMEMVSDRKLNKAEVDYCFNVAQADANMKLPSPDEMEALTNVITQILPSTTEFKRRFEFLGAQEQMRIN